MNAKSNAISRIIILAIVIIAAIGIMYFKKVSKERTAPSHSVAQNNISPMAQNNTAPMAQNNSTAQNETPSNPNSNNSTPTTNTPSTKPLPKLLDFGSVTCIPCKAMKPILDELRKEYAGKLEVTFIDVEEQKDMAELYNIQIRPTQLFMSADDKELYRNEGFLSKEEILAKCRELKLIHD